MLLCCAEAGQGSRPGNQINLGHPEMWDALSAAWSGLYLCGEGTYHLLDTSATPILHLQCRKAINSRKQHVTGVGVWLSTRQRAP